MKRTRQVLLALCALVGGLYAADTVARKLIHHDDPEYPTIAAKLALHGTVKLRVWIAPDGTVRRVEYIGGHPLLAESAVKAVKGWKFDSAEKESSEIVEVKF